MAAIIIVVKKDWAIIAKPTEMAYNVSVTKNRTNEKFSKGWLIFNIHGIQKEINV